MLLSEQQKSIELQTEISKLNIAVENWSSKYSTLEKAHQDRCTELKELKDYVGKKVYQKEINRLTKKVRDTESDAREKDTKLCVAEKQCIQKQQEISKLSKNITNSSALSVELKAKISTLTEELETNKNNTDRLTKTLKDYENTIKNGKIDAEEKIENISKLTKYSDEWPKKYAQLEENHATIYKEMHAKINDLTAEVEIYKNNDGQLRKQLKHVENDAEEKLNEIWAEKSAKFKEQIEELNGKINTLTSEDINNQLKLNYCEATLQHVKNEAEETHNKFEAEQEKCAEQQKEIEKVTKNNETLSKKYTELQENLNASILQNKDAVF